MRLFSRLRRHRDVTKTSQSADDVTMTSPVQISDVTKTSHRRHNDAMKRLTIRVPMFQFKALEKECKAVGIFVNEATVMLYAWILNKRLEFQVIKKIRENQP